MNYILDDQHNPVLVDDLLTWANWFEAADRHVALTELDGVKVSTVFLGIDHNLSYGAKQPILFETMIFGGEHDEACWRCSTWQEAEAQHERVVAELLGGI